MSELAAHILGHGFFRGWLKPEDARLLARNAELVEAGRDEYLFREDAPADRFYLILSGSVMVETIASYRKTVRLQTAEAGQVLGWSWLIPPHRWRFDARILEPVAAVALSAAPLRALCAKDNALGYQLLARLTATIAGRLEATRRQLIELHDRFEIEASRI